HEIPCQPPVCQPAGHTDDTDLYGAHPGVDVDNQRVVWTIRKAGIDGACKLFFIMYNVFVRLNFVDRQHGEK
ncbi:MAG: hypothetical protein MJE63_34310, partial [Proteobacteria bacterium]|nr:hypothetical protein [Pseudomonadota bacterium]